MKQTPTKLQQKIVLGTTTLVFSLVFVGEKTFAQSARWNPPAGVEAELQLVNASREEVEVYTKNFGPLGQSQEENRRVPPGRSLRLNLSSQASYSFVDASSPNLSNSGLRLLWTDRTTGQRATLSVGQSHRLQLSAMETSLEGDLWITNLSSQSQDGEILAWKSGLESPSLQRFHLEAREVLKIPGAGLSGSALQIEGQWNLNAHWKSDHSISFATLLPNSHPLPAPRGRYFVMSDSSRSTSYLVEIEDPELIRQARLQLEHPDEFMPRILIAEIGLNEDLSNRNWTEKRQHPWSWKVTKVLRFASLASQFCDAHPQMIEDHLEAWLAGAHAGGRPLICLWSYQVVEELP